MDLFLRVIGVGALIDPGEEPDKIVDALEKCSVMISSLNITIDFVERLPSFAR